MRGRPPALVVVEQVVRLGDRHVVVQMEVLETRIPLAVRRPMVIHEQKRLVRIAAVFQIIERQIGDEVGDVAGVRDVLAVFDQDRVVIRSQPDEDFPDVETGRLAGQVPFAEDRRLVARLLQHFRKGRLRAVEAVAVSLEAVLMAVFSREDDRAAGPADRVGAETVVKQHPRGRDAVEVGGLVDSRAVAAHGVGGVIVGEDEHDVRPRFGCGVGPNRRGPAAQTKHDARNPRSANPRHDTVPLLKNDRCWRPSRLNAVIIQGEADQNQAIRKPAETAEPILSARPVCSDQLASRVPSGGVRQEIRNHPERG